MPLTAAQNLSPQVPNSLTALLQGSGQALTGALSNAVQLGRDAVNNQVQQERSLLTEQRAEINLANRRSEQGRDQFNRDRSFARDVLTSDRAFGENQRQFNALDADRDDARAIQSAESAGRNALNAEKLLGARTRNKFMEANQDAMFEMEQDKIRLEQGKLAKEITEQGNTIALRNATAAANVNAARSLQAYDLGVKTLDRRLEAGEIDIPTYNKGMSALTSAVDEQHTSAVRDEGLGGGSGEVAAKAFNNFNLVGIGGTAKEGKDAAAQDKAVVGYQSAFENSGVSGSSADTLIAINKSVKDDGYDAARFAFANGFDEAELVSRLRVKGEDAKKAIAAEKKKLGKLFDSAVLLGIGGNSLDRVLGNDALRAGTANKGKSIRALIGAGIGK